MTEEMTPAGTGSPFRVMAEVAPENCAGCGGEQYRVRLPGTEKTPEVDHVFCPFCDREEVRSRDLQEWEEISRDWKQERLMSMSELPRRLGRFTFQSFDEMASGSSKEAKLAAVEFASAYLRRPGDGEGIVFSGASGVGKSHLAVAIIQSLMAMGVPCLFKTVPGLLESARRAFDDPERPDVFGTAKGAEVLVLDDLGAERPTEWAQERLFDLINHRYVDGLSLVATTNLGPDELSPRIGYRTVSRLMEMCEWVEIHGDDYRTRRQVGR